MSIGWDYVCAPLMGLLFVLPVIHEYGGPRWDDIGRRNRRTQRNTCPSAILSTTKLTLTDPGANQNRTLKEVVTGSFETSVHINHLDMVFCSKDTTVNVLLSLLILIQAACADMNRASSSLFLITERWECPAKQAEFAYWITSGRRKRKCRYGT
jgi:hypothetical protein